MARQKSMYFIHDNELIAEFIESKSPSMFQYIKNHTTSNYFLFYKYITHSDLISSGKRNEKQGFDKNYLYYLSPEEKKS